MTPRSLILGTPTSRGSWVIVELMHVFFGNGCRPFSVKVLVTAVRGAFFMLVAVVERQTRHQWTPPECRTQLSEE